MGTDKALLTIADRPQARRVADALVAAGADRVVAVGGAEDDLAALGLEVVADAHPGEGPLGGILTAIDALADHEVVVVLACDLVTPDPEAVATVVAALGAADVAAPERAGRLELLHAAYHRRARPHLAAAFAAGERAVHRACRGLTVVAVPGLADHALADADRPEELPPGAGPVPGAPGPAR